MNYKEFREYRIKKEVELDRSANTLLILEDYGADSLVFAEAYEGLLKQKLEYLRVAIKFFDDMYKNSFWFMKPLVAKRLRRLAFEHSITVHNLVVATMYRKQQQPKA